MICVDIEASGGLSYNKGIWQIGAIELEDPENTFLEEARIDDSDDIDPSALAVTGKTESELRDSTKQSQKELLQHFFEWAKKIKNHDVLADHPQYDFAFLRIKAEKYGLEFPFYLRCLDLHTLAQMKYHQVKGQFLLSKEQDESDMGLNNILALCGIPDTRIWIIKNEIVVKGTPHNGLEDAKLEAECFSRIVYGKNLMKELEKYPVPDYLKK